MSKVAVEEITQEEFIELARECGVTINQSNIAVVYIPKKTKYYAELFTTEGAKIMVWLEPERKLAFVRESNPIANHP